MHERRVKDSSDGSFCGMSRQGLLSPMRVFNFQSFLQKIIECFNFKIVFSKN